MNRILKNRIAKLEIALMPAKKKYRGGVITYAHNGIREETNEQAIQRHLIERPEDTGREFNIHVVNFVSPKAKDSEGMNVW